MPGVRGWRRVLVATGIGFCAVVLGFLVAQAQWNSDATIALATPDATGELRPPNESVTPEVPYEEPSATVTPVDLGEPLKEPVVIGIAGRLISVPAGATLATISVDCDGIQAGEESPPDGCADGQWIYYELRLRESLITFQRDGTPIGHSLSDDGRAELEAVIAQLSAQPRVVKVVSYAFDGDPAPEDTTVTIAGHVVDVARGWVVARWDFDGSGRVITEIRIGASRMFVDEATGQIVMSEINAADRLEAEVAAAFGLGR